MVAQQQQLFKLQHNDRLINGKKTHDSSKKLDTRVAVLKTKTDISRDKSLFANKKKKG